MKCPACGVDGGLGITITIKRFLPVGKFHSVQLAGAQVPKSELQMAVDEHKLFATGVGDQKVPYMKVSCKDCQGAFVYFSDGFGVWPLDKFDGVNVPTKSAKAPTLPTDFTPPPPAAATPVKVPTPAKPSGVVPPAKPSIKKLAFKK